MVNPTSRDPRAGVLALQGSFEPHEVLLRRLGLAPVRVTRAEHLDGLTHLVIPGGESTTMHKLLTDYALTDPLRRAWSEGLSIFGTCAGAILLGRAPGEEPPPRLCLADVVVHRNAYGRQVDSFAEEIFLEGLRRPFRCVFIRAPRFSSPGPSLQVLGSRNGEPILLRGERLLLGAFHPELTQDPAIHELFVFGSEPAPCMVAPGAGSVVEGESRN